MKLAKDHIDVGVRTNNLEAMLEFWTRDIGLPTTNCSRSAEGFTSIAFR
jgi:hypothetical protein